MNSTRVFNDMPGVLVGSVDIVSTNRWLSAADAIAAALVVYFATMFIFL